MPKYKIQQTDLWYIVKKIENEKVLYRNGKYRDKRRSNARTYYFEDDALSGLMIAKRCLESD